MSQQYWVCQGIGFDQSAIVPFLDADKLVKLINDHAETAHVGEDFLAKKKYRKTDHISKVLMILDEFIGMEHFELAGLLASANEEGVLIAATNGERRYFLLYPPRYPWENTGEFANQKYLVEYIAEQVLPFCRDDVSRQNIIGIIDTEIHEIGCG